MVPSGQLVSVLALKVLPALAAASVPKDCCCHPGEGPLKDDTWICLLSYDPRRGESP